MMFQVTSVLLVVHALLAWFVMRRASTADHVDGQGAEAPIDSPNGFLLVFRSPYLRLIALLLVLLNVVNTTGEQILSTSVYERAVALADAGEIDDVGAWIGAFYGDFFGWVNLATVLVQALLVSRIVKLFGIRGVVFALPIVALGVYGSLALGAGFAAFRIAKMAENTTDYSVMNTAKAMLWLPTSRAEKYKAKQAVDTFFVRFGDLIAAGFVFVAAELLSLGLRSFAVFNLVMIAAWFGVAVLVVRRYRALADSDAQASDQA
jgi:AAA family ATP:ADP antiporter